MNKITDTEILDYIQNRYSLVTNKYSERKILGLFVVGNANYGFAESLDELIIIAVYVPDFEELCFAEIKNEYIENVHLMDIRSFYNAAVENNEGYALEMLYSYYTLISPIYSEVFIDCFLDKLDIITNYSDYLRLNKLLSRMTKANEENNLFEVARLNAECHAFLENKNTIEWLRPSSPITVNYLWGVKNGDIKINAEEIFEDTLTLLHGLDKNASAAANKEAQQVIKIGILKLMDIALYKKIDIDGFKSSLTSTEIKALAYIKSQIKDSTGYIIVSKAIKESNISRPVFTNLFQKMESNKVAEVTNTGVKGMYIKFLERELYEG